MGEQSINVRKEGKPVEVEKVKKEKSQRKNKVSTDDNGGTKIN